jgi:hypothetical protein
MRSPCSLLICLSVCVSLLFFVRRLMGSPVRLRIPPNFFVFYAVSVSSKGSRRVFLRRTSF